MHGDSEIERLLRHLLEEVRAARREAMQRGAENASALLQIHELRERVRAIEERHTASEANSHELRPRLDALASATGRLVEGVSDLAARQREERAVSLARGAP